MARLMASGPTRMKRGKERVIGPRKLNEWSFKPMGLVRGRERERERERVNGPRKPRKWVSKLNRLAQKPISSSGNEKWKYGN